MKTACAALLLVALMPAHAQTGPAIELTQSSDRLSNGSPDWRSEELRLSAGIAARHLLEGTVRHTNRFGLNDTQIEVNYAFPLAKQLTCLVTASDSTTHRVLPKNDLIASLQYEFAPAWIINAGAGRTAYDNAGVNKLTLGVEHYFSKFRWAAGWRPTRVDGVGASSGDLRLDYYYSDADTVGVVLAAGQEASNIDTRGVVVSTVRSAGLIGRHGIGRNWKIRYGIERVKQGDFYNRTGIRLGAQYAF